MGTLGKKPVGGLNLIFNPSERLQQRQIQQQALDAYFGSRVPISEYLERKEDLGFQLEINSRGNPRDQKWMAKWQAELLDLDKWYMNYLSRNPMMQIGISDHLDLFKRRALRKLNSILSGY